MDPPVPPLLLQLTFLVPTAAVVSAGLLAGATTEYHCAFRIGVVVIVERIRPADMMR